MVKRPAGPFSTELLDTLLEGRDLKSGFDSGDLIGDLKKTPAERMLDAEMDVHLEPDAESSAGNYRNGTSAKTALTPEGPMEL